MDNKAELLLTVSVTVLLGHMTYMIVLSLAIIHGGVNAVFYTLVALSKVFVYSIHLRVMGHVNE